MSGMRYQPQGRAQIRPEWIARGLKFAYIPGGGFINAASQVSAAQSAGDPLILASPVGKTFTGGARAEFDLVAEARNGLTIIAIIRASDGVYGNSARSLASTRTAGNGGWTWGKGAASGGFARQQIVFQGVATINESAYGIDPAVDTPIACRYNPDTGRVTFFRFGVQTSDHAAALPRVSGPLVLGAQGPYAGNLLPWNDQAAGLLIIEGALRDDEIAQLSRSTSAFWQVFAADEDDSPSASAAASYSLPVARAAFGLTGGQVGMRVSRRLRVAPAALAVSSGPVTVRAARRVSVQSAGFALLAGSARMLVSRRLGVQPAALAVAGQGVALRAGRRMQVAPMSLAIAGGPVVMQYSPALVPGEYTLPISAAAMTLGGGSVGMRVTRRLPVVGAQLQIAAGAARALVGRRLLVAGAGLEVRGGTATLRYSGAAPAFDISKIHPSRLVIFEGSGSRVTLFEGSGSRITPFDGSGSRVTPFEGSGSRITRFE